jgi:AraC-like DNA-binding protein
MKAALADSALIFSSRMREQVVTARSRYRWNSYNRGGNPFVILQWTRSGAGVIEGERGQLRVPADHAFVVVAPERSTYYYPPDGREPWAFHWMNFSGALAITLFKAFQDEFGPVVFLSSQGAAAAALRRLQALVAKAGQQDRRQLSLLAYTFILEWWREASEPDKASRNGLDRAIRFCREHFREPLGVKEIASESGLSREHFSRLFSKRMKATPAAFLRNLRLREAESFLRHTHLPLKEIAMRSGFYSARHLMRAFQRTHGQSPSTFRSRRDRGKPTPP